MRTNPSIYGDFAAPPAPLPFSIQDTLFLYNLRLGAPAKGAATPFPRLDGRHDVYVGTITTDGEQLTLHPTACTSTRALEVLVSRAIEVIDSGDLSLGKFGHRMCWCLID